MFSSFFGNSEKQQQSQQQEQQDPFVLIVIQADDYDWTSIMETATATEMAVETTINGIKKKRPLQIIQTSWDDLHVGPCDNYSRDERHRCMVNVRKTFKDGKGTEIKSNRAIFPDFVLIRNECAVPGKNFTHKLLGLMYGNVPAFNSIRSIYLNIERPVMMAALNAVASKLNKENKFPMKVVNQQFFPDHAGFMYSQKFPCVWKAGSAHAGTGKLVVNDHHQMEDVRSIVPILAAAQQYSFGEPFLKGQCDLRLQKIGPHYRAFRRTSVSGNWKTQTGSAILENINVEPRYKHWLDACSTMFGNDDQSGMMDLLTIDVLVEEGTNDEIVLEVNGTSSGFGEEKEATEDNLFLAKCVLDKIKKIYQ